MEWVAGPLPDFDHTFLFRKSVPKLRQDPPGARIVAARLLNGVATSSSPFQSLSRGDEDIATPIGKSFGKGDEDIAAVPGQEFLQGLETSGATAPIEFLAKPEEDAFEQGFGPAPVVLLLGRPMPLERDDPDGFRNGGVEGDGNLSPAALAGLFAFVGVGEEAGDGGEQEGAETALGGVGVAQPFLFQEAGEEGLGQVLGGFGLTPGQTYQSYLVASNAAGIRSTPMQSFRTGISQVSNLGDDGLGSLRSVMDHAPAGTIIDLRGLSGVVTLTQGPLRVYRDVTLVGPGEP